MGKRDIWDLPRQFRYKGAVISPIHTKQELRFSVSHTTLAPLFPEPSGARDWIAKRRQLQKLGLLQSIYRPNRTVPVPYSHSPRRGGTLRKSARTSHQQLRKKRLTYRKGMHRR